MVMSVHQPQADQIRNTTRSEACANHEIRTKYKGPKHKIPNGIIQQIIHVNSQKSRYYATVNDVLKI